MCKKLSNRYKGPYKIVTVIDDANYKIKTLSGSRLMIVNKARLKRCFPRRFMLELDSDSNQNSANDIIGMSPPNDMNPIQTSQNKTVRFNDSIETIGHKIQTKRKKKIPKIPHKKTTTTTNLSTAVNTNKHTKEKTTHSEAHNKEIQSEIQQKNQTENIGTDDYNGKRIRKKPEFYQAGVNRK